MSLEHETPAVRLAVDLIMLLEDNHIEPAVALAALDIVQRDYQRKAALCSSAATDTATPPSPDNT
ncbi:DUF2496 domain-containing protein [Dickeya lacustris]|uniref:DUF2496 domain-containing protein n=1 Tax=Dickeya lacustris TaxID=2259638 RepID=A0ABY8G5Y0_9GAMM|nr:DUF2496 domain-containing protein [Dickeya lacustris]WFN55343.1 DUF2496 domain-containing protein [Dickeya lacustris]